MNHREIATALASLTEDQVKAIVDAAKNVRAAEAAFSVLGGKKTRRRRGPNKPKPEPEPEPAPVRKGGKKAAKPLSSALDRLKAVKAGGVKARRVVVDQEDED